MKNAKTILQGLKDAGYTVYGGENAPYIWLKTPDSMSSWDFFDHLLSTVNIVGTPGSGFGAHGEGYFRLSGPLGPVIPEQALWKAPEFLFL